MKYHEVKFPDYGTGQKKLGIYLIGLILCVLLTLFAFWAVTLTSFHKWSIILMIYAAATLQLFIQLICFIRLNTQTEQGRLNVMSFIFTGVILTSIVVGSLWIMWNLNYNMGH